MWPFTRKKEVKEQEPSLDDYLDKITRDKLEELAEAGRDISIYRGNEELRGKIRRLPLDDGYTFVCRIGKDIIVEIGRIVFKGESVKYNLLDNSLYDLGNGNYMLSNHVSESAHYRGSDNPFNNWNKLNNFLSQRRFDFAAA